MDAGETGDHGAGLVEARVNAPGWRLGRQLDELGDEAREDGVHGAVLQDVLDQGVKALEVLDDLVAGRGEPVFAQGDPGLGEAQTVRGRGEQSVGDLGRGVGVERPTEELLDPVLELLLLLQQSLLDVLEVPPVDQAAGRLHLHDDLGDGHVDPPIDPLQLAHVPAVFLLDPRERAPAAAGGRLLAKLRHGVLVQPVGPHRVVHRVDAERLLVAEGEHGLTADRLVVGRHLDPEHVLGAVLEAVAAAALVPEEVAEHGVRVPRLDGDRLVAPAGEGGEAEVELAVGRDLDHARQHEDRAQALHRLALGHGGAEVAHLALLRVAEEGPLHEREPSPDRLVAAPAGGDVDGDPLDRVLERRQAGGLQVPGEDPGLLGLLDQVLGFVEPQVRGVVHELVHPHLRAGHRAALAHAEILPVARTKQRPPPGRGWATAEGMTLPFPIKKESCRPRRRTRPRRGRARPRSRCRREGRGSRRRARRPG